MLLIFGKIPASTECREIAICKLLEQFQCLETFANTEIAFWKLTTIWCHCMRVDYLSVIYLS